MPAKKGSGNRKGSRKVTKKVTRKVTRKVTKPKVTKSKKTVKRKVNKKKESFELTSEQPSYLYTRDLGTGQETMMTSQTFTNPDDETITLVSSKESRTPETTVETSSGTATLSSSQKRAMVVQYYAKMEPQRFKKHRKHSAPKRKVSSSKSKRKKSNRK